MVDGISNGGKIAQPAGVPCAFTPDYAPEETFEKRAACAARSRYSQMGLEPAADLDHAAREITWFYTMLNITDGVRIARVLVVEDDRLLRQLAVETLCDDGFNVTGVERGADALDCLKSLPDVALLVTDINMPGMSGLDLARVAQQRFPQVRLLLISGREPPHPSDLPHAFQFLQKPFSAKSFLTQVRSLIDE